jgi:hypothetical protein
LFLGAVAHGLHRPTKPKKEGMNRFIAREVRKKITANQQRAANVLQHDEREREALKQLNQKTNEQCKNSIPQNSRY